MFNWASDVLGVTLATMGITNDPCDSFRLKLKLEYSSKRDDLASRESDRSPCAPRDDDFGSAKTALNFELQLSKASAACENLEWKNQD